MTFETTSQMQVVRKQEKEPKLKDFIRQELSQSAGDQSERCCLVMARSADSPVVRALSDFSAELMAKGVKVRAVLASLELTESAAAAGNWLAACETRWMRNPRLVDAHELLVIGADSAWVGDCMRRDPQKRDAFELYSSGNPAVSGRTITSFERIWELSEPVPGSHKWTPASRATANEASGADSVTAVAAVAEATPPPMPGATRH